MTAIIKKIKQEKLEAQAQALTEAAEHLVLDWTDNPIERREGLLIAKKLLKMSDGLWTRALRLQS